MHKYVDLAVFEPGAKHTFDQAAGKGVANPTAALLASAKMLQVIIEFRCCWYEDVCMHVNENIWSKDSDAHRDWS